MDGFGVSHIFLLARMVLGHVIYPHYGERSYNQSYIPIRMNGVGYVHLFAPRSIYGLGLLWSECEKSIKYLRARLYHPNDCQLADRNKSFQDTKWPKCLNPVLTAQKVGTPPRQILAMTFKYWPMHQTVLFKCKYAVILKIQIFPQNDFSFRNRVNSSQYLNNLHSNVNTKKNDETLLYSNRLFSINMTGLECIHVLSHSIHLPFQFLESLELILGLRSLAEQIRRDAGDEGLWTFFLFL